MLNLPTTHPGAATLLQEKGFIVNRSSVPGSRCAVDRTIEQTINKHAKSQGEIIDFSSNLSAYYRWCTTRHATGLYDPAVLQRADMDDHDSSAHKDLRCTQITQSEEDTVKVTQTEQNFLNPVLFMLENYYGTIFALICCLVKLTKMHSKHYLTMETYVHFNH
jgi:hypothetical protein